MLVRCGEGNLVAGYDRISSSEEIHIFVCNVRRCGAIHEDGVLQSDVGKCLEISFIRCAFSFREFCGNIPEVQSCLVKYVFAAVGKPAYMKTLSCAFRNFVPVPGNDVHQSLANNAESRYEQIDVLDCCLVEKLIVDVQDGAVHIL